MAWLCGGGARCRSRLLCVDSAHFRLEGVDALPQPADDGLPLPRDALPRHELGLSVRLGLDLSPAGLRVGGGQGIVGNRVGGLELGQVASAPALAWISTHRRRGGVRECRATGRQGVGWRRKGASGSAGEPQTANKQGVFISHSAPPSRQAGVHQPASQGSPAGEGHSGHSSILQLASFAAGKS